MWLWRCTVTCDIDRYGLFCSVRHERYRKSGFSRTHGGHNSVFNGRNACIPDCINNIFLSGAGIDRCVFYLRFDRFAYLERDVIASVYREAHRLTQSYKHIITDG